MTADLVHLAACEAGFLQSAVPVWVNDAQTMRLVWANAPAVAFWRAPSTAALLSRDIFSSAPPDVVARTYNAIERVRRGEVWCEEWTFYPGGEPTTVSLELRGIWLANDSLGLLNQALPLETLPVALRRASAMFRHTGMIAVMVDADGKLLATNPAAQTTFGDTPTWTAWFVEKGRARRVLKDALSGKQVHVQLKAKVGGDRRWHSIHARSLRDPVSGGLVVLVEQIDETARIEAEQSAKARQLRIKMLSSTLELVDKQRQRILELSAPILDVGRDTLAIPIIGKLSEEQGSTLSGKLLDTVVRRGARWIVFDLTGVAEFDPEGATRLLQLIRSLKLLGAETVIAGIRPDIATGALDTGIDFHGIRTFQSLAAFLESQ